MGEPVATYYEFPARTEAARRLTIALAALHQAGASDAQIKDYSEALVEVVLDAIELPDRKADL